MPKYNSWSPDQTEDEHEQIQPILSRRGPKNPYYRQKPEANSLKSPKHVQIRNNQFIALRRFLTPNSGSCLNELKQKALDYNGLTIPRNKPNNHYCSSVMTPNVARSIFLQCYSREIDFDLMKKFNATSSRFMREQNSIKSKIYAQLGGVAINTDTRSRIHYIGINIDEEIGGDELRKERYDLMTRHIPEDKIALKSFYNRRHNPHLSLFETSDYDYAQYMKQSFNNLETFEGLNVTFDKIVVKTIDA